MAEVYFYANDGHTGMVGRMIERSADSVRVAAHVPRRLTPYGVPLKLSLEREFVVPAQDVRELPGGASGSTKRSGVEQPGVLARLIT